jgi:hypothetical protein
MRTREKKRYVGKKYLKQKFYLREKKLNSFIKSKEDLK